MAHTGLRSETLLGLSPFLCGSCHTFGFLTKWGQCASNNPNHTRLLPEALVGREGGGGVDILSRMSGPWLHFTPAR